MLHCTLLPVRRALVTKSAGGPHIVSEKIPVIDVLSSLVTSDEADRLDIGVVTDCIDSRNGSVNNVEDTGW